MRILYFIILLILAGCSCPQVETIIRPETITVIPPVIQDTVLVAYADTVLVEGHNIVKSDTVIQVKYYPKEKKFFVKTKPDTIRIIKADTVKITHIEKNESIPYLKILMGIFAIIVLIMIWKRI